MKYKFFIFILGIFLLSSISAWSYEDSSSWGSANAYVKITGSYPVCDGIQKGQYCAGNYYVDVSYSGDKFYMGYSYTEYNVNANGNGYSGISASSSGRKILPNKNGYPVGYILCAWDKDTTSGGEWTWIGKCGGYNVDTFPELKVVNCISDNDCSAENYCDKSNDWQNWNCESKINVYQFSNNECSNIKINPVSRTNNNYDTLIECELNIKETYYRFLDNVCSSISLTSSEKTANDYNTLAECENKVIIDNPCPVFTQQTCNENQHLENKTVNDCFISQCVDNKDVEINKTIPPTLIDSFKEKNIPIIYLIPLLGLIVFAFIIYKKKNGKKK